MKRVFQGEAVVWLRHRCHVKRGGTRVWVWTLEPRVGEQTISGNADVGVMEDGNVSTAEKKIRIRKHWM